MVSCPSRDAAGCVILLWLFNVYMNDVVREVNARMLGRCLSLVNADGKEWNMNQLLFADDRCHGPRPFQNVLVKKERDSGSSHMGDMGTPHSMACRFRSLEQFRCAVGQALSRLPGGVSHGVYGEWEDRFLKFIYVRRRHL